MQSSLEPGKCPICGDRYYEKLVLPDGTEIRQVGTSVLASDRNISVETNYRDSYIVLDDLTLTRVSYCAKHNPTSDDLLAIFQMTREFVIGEQRIKGGESAALQIVKWESLNVVDTATTETEAVVKLEALQQAVLVGE